MEPTYVTPSPLAWAGFLLFVFAMLGLDLGVFNRKAHAVRFKEALTWSAVWISLAMLFNLGIWWRMGGDAGLEFFTGYLIEKSLSVDNIFVFIVLFAAMRIPAEYQHRVLFWGILSALVLRGAMIFGGVALLQRFHWLIYIFGGFLIFTGVRMFLHRNEEEHPEDGRVLKLLRRIIPTSRSIHGKKFFIWEDGRRVGTPLLLTLVMIEVTDVIFAVDSIPAIFAVTQSPFIIFTSNIFAILGLRSLYFLLAGMMEKFHYLKVGLSAVLVFVGIKMVLAKFIHLNSFVSMGVIAIILATSVFASFVRTRALREQG
ncbi:MAG: TerC family protein [Myxococcaceae bacterium]